MNLTIALPFLACIIGLVVYLVSVTNAKITEAGRLMFACGLLVTLFEVATHVVRL